MYLKRLYQNSAVLGVFVFFFAAGTVFFNFLGLQTTPFYVWAMFSEKLPIKPSPTIYTLVADGDTLNYTDFATNNLTRTLLVSTLALEDEMREQHEDPLRAWLKTKLKTHYTAWQPCIEAVTNDTSRASTAKIERWRARYLEQQFHRKNIRILRQTYSIPQ